MQLLKLLRNPGVIITKISWPLYTPQFITVTNKQNRLEKNLSNNSISGHRCSWARQERGGKVSKQNPGEHQNRGASKDRPPGNRLATSRLIDMRQNSDRRATESRGDDLSRLHGFEFNLHIAGGKIGL